MAEAATVIIGGARAVYVGPSLKLAPHRNAAATLAIGLERPFDLTLAAPITTAVALVPAGARHRLVAHGAMAFFYCDALAEDAGALGAADLSALRARVIGNDPARLSDWTLAEWAAALGLPAPGAADPRVAEVAKRLATDPDAFPSSAAAAREAGLSPSRFQALFRAAMGVPFQRFRLWVRMARAGRALAVGGNLTTAAYEAGLSSSAHFSTAFRDLFGLAPSRLLAGGTRIKVEA